jgi:hypothetical protein
VREFLLSCLTNSRYSDWLRAGRLRGRSSSPGRVKNFLFSTSSRPALGSTQPPIQWVPGALFPGVKRPGREADHSPPASAEAKKNWIYTTSPPYAFIEGQLYLIMILLLSLVLCHVDVDGFICVFFWNILFAGL